MVYSGAIAEALKRGASITTSLDAGCEETFTKIRGKPGFYKVLDNLRRYAEIAPHQVTIKYIFTEINDSVEEVAKLFAEINGLGCNLQISSDFKSEAITQNQLWVALNMMDYFVSRGWECVFLDDLIRPRMPEIDFRTTWKADYHKYPDVAIWGAGRMAEMLLETHFCQNVECHLFDDEKHGQTIFGKYVHKPDTLNISHMPIVIAASQSYPDIYWSLEKRGIDPKRVIKKAVG
jgi:sulfatase maturation enzyme AslB (radical SAM superfamily)